MAKFTANIRNTNKGKNVIRDIANSLTSSGSGYHFLTGIVKEHISEPEDYVNRTITIGTQSYLLRDLIKKKDALSSQVRSQLVINSEDYELMTKNCIIAYIVDGQAAAKKQPPILCYPFFPSHISLPAKPGEHVWILKEESGGRDVYYWMCRKPGVFQTEDTNYTHVERLQIVDNKLSDKKEADLFSSEDFVARDYASFDNSNPSNLPAGWDNNKIVTQSSAYREEFTGEPVPPVRKKCGDTLLQGSNNAMLHLTTEKFKSSEKDPSLFTGTQNNPGIPGRMPFSPAIDLCVARKKSELDLLKSSSEDVDLSGDVSIIKNRRGTGFENLEHYEINKVEDVQDGVIVSNRGMSVDFSATNCGSRLYLSNNCSVDEVFGTSYDVLDGYGGSSIVAYSDHTRLVADGTLRLTNRLGESFLDFDPEGNIVMKSSIDNGQQFLSLQTSGTSRLQARDKIEFAVRSNNDAPDEPYVLYSELRDLLEDMCADIAGANAFLSAFGKIVDQLEKLPPVGPPLLTALETADGQLQTAGATKLFAADAKITTGTFPALKQAPGKLGSGNTPGARGKIASTKIFGE